MLFTAVNRTPKEEVPDDGMLFIPPVVFLGEAMDRSIGDVVLLACSMYICKYKQDFPCKTRLTITFRCECWMQHPRCLTMSPRSRLSLADSLTSSRLCSVMQREEHRTLLYTAVHERIKLLDPVTLGQEHYI